ncbi:hypothetical protein L861_15640 [Litchfieldella anticariensis FP35 = DSM 16096]|uniref:Uncharacterized protein n=1 Tax=Litchfieldella anticariensis (strain DSM 16096 / CECT 5854 / CIP 108499 / LMG 22089 / FP35) TaxID=1121939 RepID=S2LBN0_LITA3|nr:hypothetical protein [Halomonas anticariensis]EPC02141.1 hypothetical protein L861_15640 [Halomonas anticariensis FP35 = DSM 16096]
MVIRHARQLTRGEISAIHEGAILDYPYVETERESFFEVTEKQVLGIRQTLADDETVWVNGQRVIELYDRPLQH